MSEFNAMFDEFIQKLKGCLPHETKLWSHHEGFHALKKANSKAPVEIFVNVTHPFAESIFNHDEDYFINSSKIKDTTQLNLADYWEQLSVASRDSLWTYMENLLILGWQSLGINTFSKKLLKQIIQESPSYMPSTISSYDNFKGITELIKKKYVG